MPLTPIGFVHCTTELHASFTPRAAVVTYGAAMDELGDLDDQANEIQVAFATAWKAKFPTAVTIGPTVIRGGTTSDPVIGTSASASSELGQNTDAKQPSNVAAIVHLRTGKGGRRQRGRIYLPWVLADVEVNQGGTIDPTPLAALGTSAENWRNTMNTAGHELHVLHSPSGPEVGTPTTPGPPTPVTATAVDPIVGTQRRRLGR